MTTLRDVLHLAEERAAVLRALDMDKDRTDQEYMDLSDQADDLCAKMSTMIVELPLEQRQQLSALFDSLDEVLCGEGVVDEDAD